MEGASSSSDAPNSSNTVSLRVFSQRPEPNSTILLSSISLDTTVSELKSLLRDQIDSKPSSSDQRLIHRGRLLIKDSDTLRRVFTADEIEKSQPLTLHLVVRDPTPRNGPDEVPPPAPQAPPAAPANHFTHPIRRQQEAIREAQRLEQFLPPPRPMFNSTPPGPGNTQHAETNGHHDQIHGQMPHVPPGGTHAFPPGPILGGPNAGFPIQHGPGGITVVHTADGRARIVHPGPNNQEHLQHATGAGPSPWNTPNFSAHAQLPPYDVLLAPQGQPAHWPQGLQPQDPSAGANRSAGGSRSGSPATAGADGRNQTNPINGPDHRQVNGWRREGTGWSFTVNSNFPVPAAIQNPSHPMFPRHMVPPTASNSNTQSASSNLLSTSTLQQHSALLQALECLIRCRDQAYGIERHFIQETNSIRIRSTRFVADFVSGNLVSTIQTRNRAQEMVNQALRSGAAGEETLQALGLTEQGLRSLEQEFRDVVARLRTSIDAVMTPAPATNPDHTSSNSDGNISGYLLSSPQGQQALLLDSHGALIPEPAPQNGQQNEAFQPIAERMTRILHGANRRSNHRDRRNNGGHHQNERAANLVPNHDNQRARERANRLADPERAPHGPHANDFGILVPVFRALWILVRVAGFIWFFSSGSMTRRSWLLCLSAVIVFAAQAAVVRAQLDRVRQYFEDILAGPDAQRNDVNQHGRPDRQRNGEQGDQPQQADDATGQVGRRRPQEPTPEATAERLLREARQTQQGRLQEVLRAVERAIVLFFGSLYPGVGERQVQARERLLREQEQREAQAALPAPDAENTDAANDTTATAGEGATAEQQEPSTSTSAAQPDESAEASNGGGTGSSTSADPTAGSTGEIRQRQVEGSAASS